MSRVLPFVSACLSLLALLGGGELAAACGASCSFRRWSISATSSLLFVVAPERLHEAWVSLYRALGGFGLAAVVGIFLGILMGRSKLVAGLLDPLFSGTYAVPKLALFPIFIFVFGIGSLSKVALVFLECLYPDRDHELSRRAQRATGCCSGRRRTWAPRAPRPCAAS